MNNHKSKTQKTKSGRVLGFALALSLLTVFPAFSQPAVVGHSFTANPLVNGVLPGGVMLTVNFDIALDPSTAVAPTNYQLAGATLSNGVLAANGQDVSFEVAGVFGGDPYTVNVSGVLDVSSIPMVATNLTGNLPPIRSSYPGGTMTLSSMYPGFPLSNVRDGLVNPGNFAATHGFDNSWWELDLGTPVLIEELAVWFRYQCCNSRSANVIFTIMDAARNPLWTASKGPDYVPDGPGLNSTNFLVSPAVMGQIVRLEHPVGNTDPLELSEVAVLGPSSGLCIVTQPASQTVLPGSPVTFAVGVSGTNEPITYQWKHEGTNLPGATNLTLSIPSAGPANAGLYSVVVSDSTSRQRTSVSALLSLLTETVPPAVVGHVFTFNRFSDELKLTVEFSEPVEQTSATNAANYVVVGAGTLVNGIMNPGGQRVTFDVTGGTVGCANYTLTVSGVRDLALNSMAPASLTGMLPFIQHSYKGGTATMSSIYDHPYNATKARDGNLLTFANTGQTGSIDEWWELDLGAPVSSGELEVWFRTDCCIDRNANLEFTIMDAARNPLWTNAIGADVLPLGVPTNFMVAPPVMGQIVRISKVLGDLGIVNLAEVLVLETRPAPCTIAPTSGTRVQDSGPDNLLVLEAEHFSQNLPAPDASWVFAPTPSALKPTDANIAVSGQGVMEAQPNAGIDRGADASTGPRLDYNVNFTSTGTFYAFVRGVGDSGGAGANDSVFIGIDGVATSGWTGFPQNAGYAWGNANEGDPIVVTTAGPHIINVWMREDGFAFDKLVISSNPTLNPTGVGPAESKVGLPSITINRTPGGLTVTWEGTATLQSSTNVAGQYNDVAGATSPYPVTPTGLQQYYRLRQ